MRLPSLDNLQQCSILGEISGRNTLRALEHEYVMGPQAQIQHKQQASNPSKTLMRAYLGIEIADDCKMLAHVRSKDLPSSQEGRI